MSDNDAHVDAEYVPLNEWPAEAWEPLLERFFERQVDSPELDPSYRYVLLRIPADQLPEYARVEDQGQP